MEQLEHLLQELRSVAPDAEQPRAPAGRRRWLFAIPVLVGLIAIGWFVFGGGTARPVATSGEARVDTSEAWTRVVADIDRGRLRAFRNDDPMELLLVEIADGPANRIDLEIMTRLRMQDLVPDRDPIRVHSVTEVYRRRSGNQEVVRLRVVDSMNAYALVDESGTVVQQMPARDHRTWLMDVQRTRGSEWKLFDVSAEVTSRSSAPTMRQGN